MCDFDLDDDFLLEAVQEVESSYRKEELTPPDDIALSLLSNTSNELKDTQPVIISQKTKDSAISFLHNNKESKSLNEFKRPINHPSQITKSFPISNEVKRINKDVEEVIRSPLLSKNGEKSYKEFSSPFTRKKRKFPGPAGLLPDLMPV